MKNSQKTSLKASYAVTKSYVSELESEKHWCLSVTGRTAVWGWTAVKSSALEVIFGAREVLGWAEMFLICNSGAIHADQYTDLSQTDCMMFCLAPSTHQRSINHQALLFSVSGRASSLLALLFYPRTFIVICSFHFFSVSSHTPHTHTLLVHAHRKKKKDKTPNESSERTSLNKWGSLIHSRGPLQIDLVYFCSIPGDEQKSHLGLRNDIYFPINISIKKVIPISFPETSWVEMKLTSCPVSISLLLTPSHKASIVDQPSI